MGLVLSQTGELVSLSGREGKLRREDLLFAPKFYFAPFALSQAQSLREENLICLRLIN